MTQTKRGRLVWYGADAEPLILISQSDLAAEIAEAEEMGFRAGWFRKDRFIGDGAVSVESSLALWRKERREK